MKYRPLFLFAALAFALTAIRPQTASAQASFFNSPLFTPVEKANLPVGGTFVSQAKTKDASYYYISARVLRQYNSNSKKFPGLYGSKDDGKTWLLLDSRFEFKNVFIHPDTGELFALVVVDSVVDDGRYIAPIRPSVLRMASSGRVF